MFCRSPARAQQCDGRCPKLNSSCSLTRQQKPEQCRQSVSQLAIDPRLYRRTETPQSIKPGHWQQRARAVSTHHVPTSPESEAMISAWRNQTGHQRLRIPQQSTPEAGSPLLRNPPTLPLPPLSRPSLSFSHSHSLSFSPHLSTLQKKCSSCLPVKLQKRLHVLSLADEHIAHMNESVRVFMKTRVDIKLSFDF